MSILCNGGINENIPFYKIKPFKYIIMFLITNEQNNHDIYYEIMRGELGP